MSGMGNGFNFNQMLDPLGTILGISPTAKLFGGGKDKADTPSVPVPAPVNGVTAEKTRAGQARSRPQPDQSTILTEATDKLGG